MKSTSDVPPGATRSSLKPTADVPPGATRYPLKVADVVVVGTGSGGGGGGSGLTVEQVDDRVAQLLQPGTGIALNYNDNANTLTISVTGSGSGGAVVSIDDTPPSSPTPAQLWWESDTGVLHIRYDDGSSSQWVAVSASGGSSSPGMVITGGGIVFETRAAATAATLDPLVKTFQTQGFGVAGDGGHGLYRRRTSAPPATWVPPVGFPEAPPQATQANPGYIQTADGAWFELVPQGGLLFIEQFGGMNDSDLNGVIGRDNYDAHFHAMQYPSWKTNDLAIYTYEIRYQSGHYRFGQFVEIHYMTRIKGGGSGISHGNTWWHFPPNTNMVAFQGGLGSGKTDYTGPGGGLSGAVNRGDGGGSIEGINIYGKPSSTDHTKAGLILRSRVTVRDVAVGYCGGDGFYIFGVAGGTIADFVVLENCSVHSCSRDGLHIVGNDANVCLVTQFDAHGPTWEDGQPISGGIGGCGIWTDSAFGCSFHSIHIAGFGNHGVYHKRSGESVGAFYRFLRQAGEPAFTEGPWTGLTPGQVEPGSSPQVDRQIWYRWSTATAGGEPDAPNAQFPQWVPNPTIPHRAQMPIISVGALDVFTGIYVETGVPCHIAGSVTSIGGASGGTRYSNHMQGMVLGQASGIVSQTGFGGRQSFQAMEGSSWFINNGLSTYAFYGHLVTGHEDEGIGLMSHNRYKEDGEGGMWSWRYTPTDIIYSGNYGAKNIWEITTRQTDRFYGRTVNKIPSSYLVLPEFVLGSWSDTNAGRIMGMRSAPPGAGAEEWARGDVFFNCNPTAGGAIGWVCVTTGVGVAAVWKTWGTIAA